jgi:Ca2+ transporting ATPase
MWESPLAAIQLLWVNLIMDSLAALALATEDPKPELLKRSPYRKNEYIISQRMIKHILGQSLFQAFILFFFVFGAHHFVPEGVEGPNNNGDSTKTADGDWANPGDASIGLTAW